MEDIKRINLNEVQYKVTDEDVRTKYPTLDDLPSINGQPVVGDLTLSQLGIQPQGEYARYTEVPQRVSELSNDLNFQTRVEVHDMIMDELSNFEVASFEVVDEIPTPATAREGVRYFYSNPTTGKVEEYIKIGSEVVMVGSSADVDLSNYYNKNETNALLNTKANIVDVPVRVSDLNNDRGFITKTVTDLQYYTKTTDMNAALALKADKTEIPTKVSQLTNDSGYITKSVNNLDNYTKTTDLNTSLNLKADKATTYTKTETDAKLDLKADADDIPTKTSDLTNDSNFAVTNANNNFTADQKINGKVEATNGFVSKPRGNVSTKTSVPGLVIKEAYRTMDDTPETGIVLEYGPYEKWGGQFFIPDNKDTGLYYNGWTDGIRGTWRKLALEVSPNYATATKSSKVSQGYCYYFEYENLVVAHIQDVRLSTNATSDDTLFTGLPKPKQQIHFLMFRHLSTDSSNRSTTSRLKVTTNGEIKIHYSDAYTGESHYYGTVVYVKQ